MKIICNLRNICQIKDCYHYNWHNVAKASTLRDRTHCCKFSSINAYKDPTCKTKKELNK